MARQASYLSRPLQLLFNASADWFKSKAGVFVRAGNILRSFVTGLAIGRAELPGRH